MSPHQQEVDGTQLRQPAVDRVPVGRQQGGGEPRQLQSGASERRVQPAAGGRYGRPGRRLLQHAVAVGQPRQQRLRHRLHAERLLRRRLLVRLVLGERRALPARVQEEPQHEHSVHQAGLGPGWAQHPVQHRRYELSPVDTQVADTQSAQARVTLLFIVY